MFARKVIVRAPARLHFGLFGFGQPSGRQLGGVGAMIDQPGVELVVEPAPRFTAAGPGHKRIFALAERWAGLGLIPATPPCRVEVLAAPPAHVGLGSGTQLTLAAAAGMRAFFGSPQWTGPELALAAGRGLRSAVGSHGFSLGGLLVEAGKLRDEAIGPLVARIELPKSWRFVLALPEGGVGLSGAEEEAAMAALPAVPREVTAELCREALLDLLPAAQQGRFRDFSESVYRYGYAAGMCFAPQQYGAYASAEVADLIDWLRQRGVAGVGQSSWGPGVFALAKNSSEAGQLAAEIEQRSSPRPLRVIVAAPNRIGATIEVTT